MPFSTSVGLAGLAITVVSVGVMYICMIRMIREINKAPGPEGQIPMWSLLLRTGYLYHPVQRYRAKNGKDSLYRSMQIGWLLLGIGLLGVFGSDYIGRISAR